jgi:hypothetical protein
MSAYRSQPYTALAQSQHNLQKPNAEELTNFRRLRHWKFLELRPLIYGTYMAQTLALKEYICSLAINQYLYRSIPFSYMLTNLPSHQNNISVGNWRIGGFAFPKPKVV